MSESSLSLSGSVQDIKFLSDTPDVRSWRIAAALCRWRRRYDSSPDIFISIKIIIILLFSASQVFNLLCTRTRRVLLARQPASYSVSGFTHLCIGTLRPHPPDLNSLSTHRKSADPVTDTQVSPRPVLLQNAPPSTEKQLNGLFFHFSYKNLLFPRFVPWSSDKYLQVCFRCAHSS